MSVVFCSVTSLPAGCWLVNFILVDFLDERDFVGEHFSCDEVPERVRVEAVDERLLWEVEGEVQEAEFFCVKLEGVTLCCFEFACQVAATFYGFGVAAVEGGCEFRAGCAFEELCEDGELVVCECYCACFHVGSSRCMLRYFVGAGDGGRTHMCPVNLSSD